MNKLKFILTASIATALTLSCSDGGDGSGGGSPNTEIYTLKSKTADQFTYIKVHEDEYCIDGGVLEIEEDTDENTVDYSISNNIMTWEERWGDDTLNFKGTSNEFIGTWTRTKNKAASCEIYNDDDDSWWDCKEGWDITKAVFTETNVSITRDHCLTDDVVERTDKEGWKVKVINCETIEGSKGKDKVTVKQTLTSIEMSYNGKSCKYSYPDKSKKQNACKEAWNTHPNDEYWSDYYSKILSKDYFTFLDCVERTMPPEILGEAAAKPVAKAKAKAQFMPLLKKIN